MNVSSLPLKKDVSVSYWLSIAISILTAAASLAGLSFQASLYPLEEVRQTSVATDVVNLVVVLPVLLGSVWLARRGSLTGLLFWPGALLIISYHYMAYSLTASAAWQILAYALMAGLSLYAAYGYFASVEMQSVRARLAGYVPVRMSGGMLAGFGLLFFFWRGSLVVQSLIGSTALSRPEFATAVTDVVFCPAWVIVGVLLWRGRAFGYVAGAGLLFQFSMLFVGLFVYFALQPALAGVPFPAEDFVAVLVMSLVCFVPFGLFTRGISRSASE